MQRFTRSPMRGWRWLYTFLGIMTAAAACHVFLSWPASGDYVMLVFPTILLAAGLALLFVGTIVNDVALIRFNNFLQRWGP